MALGLILALNPVLGDFCWIHSWSPLIYVLIISLYFFPLLNIKLSDIRLLLDIRLSDYPLIRYEIIRLLHLP